MEIEILDKPPKYTENPRFTVSQRQQMEEDRNKRLAEALRENLRKRKEQMRARLQLPVEV
ncbi:MAG: hypothetical protein K2P93_04755 [Alphaproteobacteria bacterium]|nr:hypothetical protein [Alphaproteobacteria bacterium]